MPRGTLSGGNMQKVVVARELSPSSPSCCWSASRPAASTSAPRSSSGAPHRRARCRRGGAAELGRPRPSCWRSPTGWWCSTAAGSSPPSSTPGPDARNARHLHARACRRRPPKKCRRRSNDRRPAPPRRSCRCRWADDPPRDRPRRWRAADRARASLSSSCCSPRKPRSRRSTTLLTAPISQSPRTIGLWLDDVAKLTITGLAFSLVFQARQFALGVQGQVYVGALAATYVALSPIGADLARPSRSAIVAAMLRAPSTASCPASPRRSSAPTRSSRR